MVIVLWALDLLCGERVIDSMKFHEGPTLHYAPVCVRHPWGFYAGPCGYKLIDPKDAPPGGVIIITHDEESERWPNRKSESGDG